MIPIFPEFKKIDISDKQSIEAHTHKHKPYSDFNFTNLWSWDTKSERKISELHGNLVVLFTDYIDGESSLSFLGTHELESTAQEIIHFAEINGIIPELRYITEESAQRLQGTDLFIMEDKENFDYIFSVAQLADPHGSKFKNKRHLANRFIREYPDADFTFCDLSDPVKQKQLTAILQRWEDNKKSDMKSCDLEQEGIAIDRLLSTARQHEVMLSCIYLHDEMIGFSIDEILSNCYAISHFIKADIAYKGIYEYLNEKVAQQLLAQNITLWNWEQDLNIEGLRRLKMSYRPINFLKKYRVSSLVLNESRSLESPELRVQKSMLNKD